MTRDEKISVLTGYCGAHSGCDTCAIHNLWPTCHSQEWMVLTDEQLDYCIQAICVTTPGTVREKVLAAAREAVCGHRTTDHGTPENNFSCIAMLWSVYKGTQFTATDVALMMALLKVARIRTGTATEDSFVDLAGYAACAAECAEREGKHE